MSRTHRIRELFTLLSGEPAHAWPDGVVHHGARVLMLLLVALATYVVFPIAPIADLPDLEPGMLAEEDIIAEIPFEVRKSSADLSRDQADAASRVPPVFRYDSTVVDSMRTRVQTLVRQLDGAADGSNPDSALRAVFRQYRLRESEDVLALVRAPRNRMALRASLERVVEERGRSGIIGSGDLDRVNATTIRVIRDGQESTALADTVLTEGDVYEVNHLPPESPLDLGLLHQLILTSTIRPTLRLDREPTEAARQAARDAVDPITQEVIRGERVVTARERLQADDIGRLDAYRSTLTELGHVDRGLAHAVRVTGSVLLNLLILLALGVAVFLFRRDVYQKFRHLLVLAGLLVAVTAAAGIIARSGAPAALIPIAFPALVIAVLWDGRLSLIYTLVLLTLLVGQADLAGPTARILMFAGGAAAALSVRAVQRRAQALILGLVVAASYMAASLGLGMILGWEPSQILSTGAWGMVNGLASAVFALGLLPVFEAATRITSDQTLLELADLNRPLLKRLSLEAPGTYAHSINVANLAEAAARSIGANPLLVRTGAYYHDVGKVLAPQFYVENQVRGRNPHDDMDPATSAAIVRQHVVEGLRLAEGAGLPQIVKNFIAEHHGTQRIGFFFDRAKEANPDAEIDPGDFSYPGPRPRSRETAIVMLADSVESASKVLSDPSSEKIAALVGRIVEAKLAQDQLDEAPLTFEDLSRIREQFLAVLNGMYHHRLDYPPLPRRASAPPEIDAPDPVRS